MTVETLPRTNQDPTQPDDDTFGLHEPVFDADGEFAGTPRNPDGSPIAPPDTQPAEAAGGAPETEPQPTATERLSSVLDFSGNSGVPTWQQVGEFTALKSEIDTTDPDNPVHKTTGEPVDAKKLADAELLLDAESRILSRETTEQRVSDSRAPKNPAEMSTEQKARYDAYKAAHGTDPAFAALPERAQVLQWKAANGAEAALSRGLLRLKREERARQQREEAAKKAASGTTPPTGETAEPTPKKPEDKAAGADEIAPPDPKPLTEGLDGDKPEPMPRAPRSDFKTKVPMPKLRKNGRPKYQKPTARTAEEIQSLMAPKMEHRGDLTAYYKQQAAMGNEELVGMQKGTGDYYEARLRTGAALRRLEKDLKSSDAWLIDPPTKSGKTGEGAPESDPDRLLTDDELLAKWGATESTRRRIFKDGPTLIEDMFEGGKKGDEYKRFAALFEEADETGGKSRESRGKVRARLRRFGGFVLRGVDAAETFMGNATGVNAAEDLATDAKQARAERSAKRAADKATRESAPDASASETKKQRVKRAARRAGRAVLKGLTASGAAQFGVPVPETPPAARETAPPRSTDDAESAARKAKGTGARDDLKLLDLATERARRAAEAADKSKA